MNDDVQETEVVGQKWWYVARDFRSPLEAEASFIGMNTLAAKSKGEANIAGYRVLDGPPGIGEPRRIVVVGHIEHKVREAADLLGGKPYRMEHYIVFGLIARRIRFLAAAQELGVGPGTFSEHYPEGRGLNQAGEVVPLPEEEQ